MTDDLDRLLELPDGSLTQDEVRALIERVREAEAIIKDLPDHSDLDAAQFKINMVVAEANAKIRKLEARLRAAEEVVGVLAHIAQYHPDWKGQRVNNAPNRRQLIDTAFYAFQRYDEAVKEASL